MRLPARFTSGEYGPDLVRLMTDALESAWAEAFGAPGDSELRRLVMASAILEQVDLGVRAHEELVAKARSALAAALRLSMGGRALPRL